MKRFILKIFIFIIPVIPSSYGLDMLLSGLLKRSLSYADGEYPVWNDLYSGKINSEIVIYGSSRALKHIDPEMIGDSILTNAYNLGVNGHTFKTQYFRHSLLLKYNQKPKLIIQTLDITGFEKVSDLYNPDQLLPYMLFNQDMESSVYSSYKPYDYKLPLIRYYGKKEALLEVFKLPFNKPDKKIVRIRGYKPMDLKWNVDLSAAQLKLGTLIVESDTSIMKLFERFFEECKDENIKVLLVFPPQYIEGQKFVSNWADIMDYYYDISKKNNLLFLDYSVDSLSFKKELFYNSGHLNKKGAEIFTNILIQEIKKIY